jgi:hypothetical protein
MEEGEIDRITEAFTAFSAALDIVRGIDAWRTDDMLKQTLRDIMARLDSDQKLARLLGDLTRQRLDRLAGTTAAATAPVTYGRRR